MSKPGAEWEKHFNPQSGEKIVLKNKEVVVILILPSS